MFKLIEDEEEAKAYYEAGLLWYSLNTPIPTEFMFPVPSWWRPANPYCYTNSCSYAIALED
jgi:hypothetical protein